MNPDQTPEEFWAEFDAAFEAEVNATDFDNTGVVVIEDDGTVTPYKEPTSDELAESAFAEAALTDMPDFDWLSARKKTVGIVSYVTPDDTI